MADDLLGKLMRVDRVLVRLLREFMSRQEIAFAMGGRRGRVGVCREVVQLRCLIVCALWHGVLPIQGLQRLTDGGRFNLRTRWGANLC